MKIETYIRCTGAQGTLVDSANLPAAVNPPILCLGMSAELRIHFFDGEALEQMDAEAFEDIGSWRLSVDTDYSQATEPILRWTTGISVGEDGTVLVAIPNVSSDKLVAALGVKQSGEYIAELMGYAAGQAVPSFVVQFPFNVYNRIDLEGGSESIPVSSGYYTNSQVDALLASAYEFQFSADGESWHNTQAGTDRWFRIKNGSVSGAQWSDPIAIPAGAPGQDGEDGDDGVSTYIYVGYASDSAGADFSLTPTDSLKYRAEIHVSSAIAEPASSDFASATWVKYLGNNGSSTVTWGGIAGTLADQADLASAFSSKQDAITDNNKLPYSRVSGGPDVGSGNLIFTSGGTQVATFNANQSSNTTVPLPAGGSGSIIGGFPVNPQAGQLYIYNDYGFANYYHTSDTFTAWGIGRGGICVLPNNGLEDMFGFPDNTRIYARHNSSSLRSGTNEGNGLYWNCLDGRLDLQWQTSAGWTAHPGAQTPYSYSDSAYPWSNPPTPGWVNENGYIIAPLGTNWRLVINTGTYEDPDIVELCMGPLAEESECGTYDGEFGPAVVTPSYTVTEIYARQGHTHSAYILGITLNGSTSGVTISGGVANLAISGAQQAITVIPAATTAYTLSEGRFTHIPTSATTYTLPAVSDNTHEHEIVLDVAFDNVQTIVFHDNSGNIVAPQDEITIAAADVWRFLCQWNTLLSCWCIMPTQMTDNTTYPPSIVISPSSYTVSGTAETALTSLDLSSNVTVTHPTSGVSATFSSPDLPAGVTITSAGVISGTPASAGVTSSTITVAYTGATSITCAAVFDIAAAPAPTPTYYYTVSGATTTPGVNGNYYVHSGTHGSSGVVYTNGTYYMFDASDCWVIHDSSSWAPEGLGPLFGSILHSDEGSYATVPTGTWINGADMPSDEATVSAYSA